MSETIQAVEAIVKGMPLGTNLGLVRMIWMLIPGQLLISRGGAVGRVVNE